MTKPKKEPRRSCFAYQSDNKKDGCGILTELYCLKNPRCRFFKTKEQRDREKENYGN